MQVEVSIYDLGRPAGTAVCGPDAGPGPLCRALGQSGESGMVALGLYLARVAVDTDLGTIEQTRTIAVAY